MARKHANVDRPRRNAYAAAQAHKSGEKSIHIPRSLLRLEVKPPPAKEHEPARERARTGEKNLRSNGEYMACAIHHNAQHEDGVKINKGWCWVVGSRRVAALLSHQDAADGMKRCE